MFCKRRKDHRSSSRTINEIKELINYARKYHQYPPYGHGGTAKNRLRVGGQGGGKMARKVIGDKNYFPIDRDALLNDNNVDTALASIKGIIEESAIEKLDVPGTIKSGLKRGGLFLTELTSERAKPSKPA